VDSGRDELAPATADLVSAQAQAAARERADELRDELADARSASAAITDGEQCERRPTHPTLVAAAAVTVGARADLHNLGGPHASALITPR
jgi:hypothetical protein